MRARGGVPFRGDVAGGLVRGLVTVVLAGVVGGLVSGTAVAGPASASGTTSAATAGVPGPVLVIGTSGVRWSDVSAEATPALWRLSRTAGLAVASTRGVEPTGCPVDGWLTVSVGTKAAAPRVGGTCAALDEPVDGAVPGWPADRSEPGVAAVRREGRCAR